jgi:hypothetical protein
MTDRCCLLKDIQMERLKLSTWEAIGALVCQRCGLHRDDIIGNRAVAKAERVKIDKNASRASVKSTNMSTKQRADVTSTLYKATSSQSPARRSPQLVAPAAPHPTRR